VRIREVLSICAAVVSLGTVFFLMEREMRDEDLNGLPDGIPPTEAQSKGSAGQQDPLLGIEFTKEQRESNFASFGMNASMVKRTMDEINGLDKSANREKLSEMLAANQGDRSQLQAALCGTTNDQRPRYGALQYLVEDIRGERRVMELRSMPGVLRRQDWAQSSPWTEVYRQIELVGDRREEDATIMAVAAILLGQEDLVLDYLEPWGLQGTDEWSWEMVNTKSSLKRYKAETRVSDYFALFHLVAELAHEDGGICQD